MSSQKSGQAKPTTRKGTKSAASSSTSTKPANTKLATGAHSTTWKGKTSPKTGASSKPSTPSFSLQEKREFLLAKKKNTEEAYGDFLKKYPKSSFKAEISALLSKLKKSRIAQEEQAFQAAQKANTLKAFAAYLKKYPAGKHLNEAKKAMDKLAFEQARERSEARLDPSFLEDYVDLVKKKVYLGQYRQAAEEKIEEIYFKLAKSEDTLEAYQNYKADFPNSRFLGEVERAIARKKREAEKEKVQRLLAESEVAPLLKYLREHPNSPYLDSVKHRLHQILVRQNRLLEPDEEAVRVYKTLAFPYLELEWKKSSSSTELSPRAFAEEARYLEYLALAYLEEKKYPEAFAAYQIAAMQLEAKGASPQSISLAYQSADMIAELLERGEQESTVVERNSWSFCLSFVKKGFTPIQDKEFWKRASSFFRRASSSKDYNQKALIYGISRLKDFGWLPYFWKKMRAELLPFPVIEAVALWQSRTEGDLYKNLKSQSEYLLVNSAFALALLLESGRSLEMKKIPQPEVASSELGRIALSFLWLKLGDEGQKIYLRKSLFEARSEAARFVAMVALRYCGRSVADSVLKLAWEKGIPRIRAQVIGLLYQKGCHRFWAQELLKLLSSSQPLRLKKMAAAVLKKHSSKEFYPLLLEHLRKHPCEEILEVIEGVSSVDFIVQAFKNLPSELKPSWEGPIVRIFAAQGEEFVKKYQDLLPKKRLLLAINTRLGKSEEQVQLTKALSSDDVEVKLEAVRLIQWAGAKYLLRVLFQSMVRYDGFDYLRDIEEGQNFNRRVRQAAIFLLIQK
ncbi:MAG: hypothetical protein D6805_01710 [Planctomycetota bacterium]|nr:MAG: hypothetical protein D6805_01710 [Planctomycetota bacterium]